MQVTNIINDVNGLITANALSEFILQKNTIFNYY